MTSETATDRTPARDTGTPAERVAAVDWAALGAELDAYGCASTPPLLTPAACRRIADLYDDVERFRSTVDMARLRFGSGQYRYFDRPLPAPVAELRAALYPYLLPVARDWAGRLGRPAPWPDDFEDWLEQCHALGQTRPTPILLTYGRGTGTPSTATCTGTRSSRSRSSSASTGPASTTRAASSCSSSSARAPSPAAPPSFWNRATASSSRPGNARSAPPAAGRRGSCGTA